MAGSEKSGRKKVGAMYNHRLSEREYKFADLILKGEVTPMQAVIAAGYSQKSPQTAVHRLMNNVHVREYIDSERRRIAERRRIETEVDDIWITQKFKDIIETCTKKRPIYYNTEDGPIHLTDQNGNPLYEYVDAQAAIKASENLAKHIGYYEIDNKQKATVIQIGCVEQKILNFFEEGEASGDNNAIAANSED